MHWLSSSTINICMKWAKNQCQKLKKSPSGENIREVLGNNLYLIRFPTMSPSEFAGVVVNQHILTDSEAFQVFRHLNSESNKPDDLPFQTERRFKTDPRPRFLTVPAPYAKINYTTKSWYSPSYSTSLSCSVSKPLLLRTIYVHGFNLPGGMNPELSVTLTQNGKCLHKYTGAPSVIPQQSPEHYAVSVDNVRVESGAMELAIVMNLKLSLYFDKIPYAINLAAPNVSRISDDYVAITFPPAKENLLLGFEYCMP